MIAATLPALTEAPAEPVPPRLFTARLLALLRIFDGCRGDIFVDARSLSGIGGHVTFNLRPPVSACPFPILDCIRDNDGLRVGLTTRSGGRAEDLPAAFVLWKLRRDFGRREGEDPARYYVLPEEQQRVGAALAGFTVLPAFLIDAGPEIVALWPLSAPLAVDKEPEHARRLLVALAERLGADVEAARDLMGTVPLAGVIRSWNGNPPDIVDLVDVAPGRRYAVEALEAALITRPTPKPHTTKGEA
jgi:hypothetical protein